MKRVAIVAGELSGDLLGADLMRALKARHPGVRFEGVGGPAMLREGLMGLYPLESLSVMGLVEVLRHLPRLLSIRRHLARHFQASPPDLFIGIDSPDFNLGLERRLRERGIPTAHYVSPSVWAWRKGRIHGIARSVDLMLTLFPFETAIYEDHEVPVAYVGHPAADRFPLRPDVAGYREQLDLEPDGPVLAILPGSRLGEVARHGPVFSDALRRIRKSVPGTRAIVAVAAAHLREPLEAMFGDTVRYVEGESEAVMGASDAVLTVSGTATLEAMLLKRPMVVAYKASPVTVWLVRHLRLVNIPFFSLPNLLAGREVVPELFQEDATADALAERVTRLLRDGGVAASLREEFARQHERLRQGAGRRAAEALEAIVKPA